MTQTEPTEHRTITVEAENGKRITIAEYPGGDMQIEKKSARDVEGIYLMSDEASALRTALGRLDSQKRGDVDE